MKLGIHDIADEATTKSKNGETVNLIAVGSWLDLAGYYRGDDGNYWAFHMNAKRFVNCGSKLTARGKTLKGEPLATLPDLNPLERIRELFEVADRELFTINAELSFSETVETLTELTNAVDKYETDDNSELWAIGESEVASLESR